MTTIGERIKEGLTIRDMIQADLVDKTGLAKSAISSYINGKYEPKQQAIHLIAKALEVNEAWLMGYDVDFEIKSLQEDEPTTIAAHKNNPDEEWTEEELKEIEEFKKFVKMKRQSRK